MKKFLSLFACAAMLLAFTGCGSDDDSSDAGQPSLEWTANPDFSTTEITSNMSVVIKANVPNGIKSFTIKVESPCTGFISAVNALIGISANKSDTAPVLDLINDPSVVIALAQLSVPTGTSLKNKTDVTMDLSSLVPMIGLLQPGANTNHVFTLTLVDNNGHTLTKAVTFHYAGIPS